MKNIIHETEHLAYVYLKGFGFADEQIIPLVELGKKNLSEALEKLKKLLNEEGYSLKDLDNILHAIKGLLLQLGNTQLAQELNAIRLELNNPKTVTSIEALLFNDTKI